jgi:hypothetical protein
MGIWGVFFAGIANIFIGSSMFGNIISVISIVAFAGLTAFQTQSMKETFSPAVGAEANSRYGWMAALNLYISFIAMFQNVLHLLNQR